jgi:hypothetical protein
MDLRVFEEYIRLHLLSLEQDSEAIQKAMDNYSNYEDDEYRTLEIEDISTNGQILACYHFLSVLEGSSDER